MQIEAEKRQISGFFQCITYVKKIEKWKGKE